MEPKPLEEETPDLSDLTLWEPGVVFTERELRLISNSQTYAMNDPAGVPGHNLMIIIDKCDQLLGQMASYLTPEQVEACANPFEESNGTDE